MQKQPQEDNFEKYYPASIYWFKVSNRKTRKRKKICLKLKIKIPPK